MYVLMEILRAEPKPVCSCKQTKANNPILEKVLQIRFYSPGHFCEAVIKSPQIQLVTPSFSRDVCATEILGQSLPTSLFRIGNGNSPFSTAKIHWLGFKPKQGMYL